jgi:hypothetical protein
MGLLSPGGAGSIPPGAPFPKEFPDFARKKDRRRTHIEKSDQSGEFAPQLANLLINDLGL